MGYYSDNYNETVKSVLGELDKALGAVEPETVEKFVQAVLEAEQVYFVGVGRVLLSLQAICKRLAHLGIKTHYVGEITEPAITDKDLLIGGIRKRRFPVPAGNCEEGTWNRRQNRTYRFQSQQRDEGSVRVHGSYSGENQELSGGRD